MRCLLFCYTYIHQGSRLQMNLELSVGFNACPRQLYVILACNYRSKE